MMFLCATLGQGSLVHHDNSNYYQASFYHQNMHHHNSQAHHGNHHHHHHGGHHHGSTASPSTLWQLWDLRYENCTSLRPTRHVLQLQQTLYRLLLAIQVLSSTEKKEEFLAAIYTHTAYRVLDYWHYIDLQVVFENWGRTKSLLYWSAICISHTPHYYIVWSSMMTEYWVDMWLNTELLVYNHKIMPAIELDWAQRKPGYIITFTAPHKREQLIVSFSLFRWRICFLVNTFIFSIIDICRQNTLTITSTQVWFSSSYYIFFSPFVARLIFKHTKKIFHTLTFPY